MAIVSLSAVLKKTIVMTDVFRQSMKKSSLKGDWIKTSLGLPS